jgi:hypothetical protein
VLLELGADPNFVDNEGNTAVHLLQHSIDFLLIGNANGKVPDLSLKNKAGLTALDALLLSKDPSPSKLLALAKAHAPTTRFPARTARAGMWADSPLVKLKESPEGREAFRLLCEDYMASRQAERATGIWFSMGVATGTCGQQLAYVQLQSKPEDSEAGAQTSPSLIAWMDYFLRSSTPKAYSKNYDRVLILRQDSEGKSRTIEVNVLTLDRDMPLEWGDIICLESGVERAQQEFIELLQSFTRNAARFQKAKVEGTSDK